MGRRRRGRPAVLAAAALAAAALAAAALAAAVLVAAAFAAGCPHKNLLENMIRPAAHIEKLSKFL